METSQNWWLLPWAKLGRGQDKIYPRDAHPVACHLLDVAFVAQQLWSACLADSVRHRWAEVLGLPLSEASRWIAFWTGCHDIGKASPGFQGQDPSGCANSILAQVGLTIHSQPVRHDHVSTRVLPDLWKAPNGWPSIDKNLARDLAAVIGGHHGIIPTASEYSPRKLSNSKVGTGRWDQVRREILGRLAAALGLNSKSSTPRKPAGVEQGFYLILAGLISVADWIGSNKMFFKPAGELADWEGYVARSHRLAEAAIKALGWTGWNPERSEAMGFRELFPFEPRPLQSKVEEIATNTAGPGLLLVEAPMGEGKTEAALYAADRHTHQRGGRGMYVALPTTATSNGMFERVEAFLEKRYRKTERTNLQLLHGRAFLSDSFEELQKKGKLEIAEVGWEKETEGRVVAEEWFAKDKKQGLLAPFAVGTIDQALLSVLQTNFGFVRLFGLAGKTVILDEVHAYDAYTSTILGRMLAWLHAIGSPVVLLSATLPRTTRHRLIAEYLHFDPNATIGISPEDNAKEYPRVTVAEPRTGSVYVETVSDDPKRRLTVNLKSVDMASLGTQLAEALEGGGTAAVICNTVSRAQALYKDLEAALMPVGIVIDLFHARFPLSDRQLIETRVLDTYGKGHTDKSRPARVLVATQVIEQSLDLDFDLMITEYAPIDLALQRAGRLQRHDRARPPRFNGNPELWFIKPNGETVGVPDFGVFEDRGNGGVYSRHILLRSFFTLKNRNTIRLPIDIEELVELVYNEKLPAIDDRAWRMALEVSRKAYLSQQADSQNNARGALLDKPDSTGLLDHRSRDLIDEDDPRHHKSKLAKTREGDPTVDVVLLYRVGNVFSLSADGNQPIDPGKRPHVNLIRQIIKRSVSLSHQGWVHHFAAQAVPSGWQKCGALRYHRIAELDSDGLYQSSFSTFRYDKVIGVELL